jgi:hypothetical protein
MHGAEMHVHDKSWLITPSQLACMLECMVVLDVHAMVGWACEGHLSGGDVIDCWLASGRHQMIYITKLHGSLTCLTTHCST